MAILGRVRARSQIDAAARQIAPAGRGHPSQRRRLNAHDAYATQARADFLPGFTISWP